MKSFLQPVALLVVAIGCNGCDGESDFETNYRSVSGISGTLVRNDGSQFELTFAQPLGDAGVAIDLLISEPTTCELGLFLAGKYEGPSGLVSLALVESEERVFWSAGFASDGSSYVYLDSTGSEKTEEQRFGYQSRITIHNDYQGKLGLSLWGKGLQPISGLATSGLSVQFRASCDEDILLDNVRLADRASFFDSWSFFGIGAHESVSGATVLSGMYSAHTELDDSGTFFATPGAIGLGELSHPGGYEAFPSLAAGDFRHYPSGPGHYELSLNFVSGSNLLWGIVYEFEQLRHVGDGFSSGEQGIGTTTALTQGAE